MRFNEGDELPLVFDAPEDEIGIEVRRLKEPHSPATPLVAKQVEFAPLLLQFCSMIPLVFRKMLHKAKFAGVQGTGENPDPAVLRQEERIEQMPGELHCSHIVAFSDATALQLLQNLIQRRFQRFIALIKAFSAGTGVFMVEGLQLIVAILLMILGATIVITSGKELITKKAGQKV